MRREYRIHPAIGVARVGDSPDDYFIGPEAPDVPPSLTRADTSASSNGQYKDAQKRIKRQGARFRIYEYSSDGVGALAPVREITAVEAQIEWQVHLVNRKAAALQFQGQGLRNSAIRGRERAKLVIDAGAQTLSGASQAMKRLQGRFMDTLNVPLGDLLTDSAGRLIVLGGFGASRSVPDGMSLTGNFANNDGWCDDVSDGPVRATLRLNGAAETIEAVPAWIIVAPPDFAPTIENVITLYDVVADIAAQIDPTLVVTETTPISFLKDIYPLLRRVSNMHWVSDFAAHGHRPGSRNYFLDPDRLANLLSKNDRSESSAASRERNRIFGALKKPGTDTAGMPLLSGGDTDVTLTNAQYRRMERWARGDFEADWPGKEPAAPSLDQLPVPERPAALDRAALQACVGAGLFPGIEVGRIMRAAPGKPGTRSPYDKERPFRIDPQLPPGTLTERMALPWQADFWACDTQDEDGTNPQNSGDWWPAQRPIQVRRSQDLTRKPEPWVPEEWQKPDEMLENWAKLGFVVKKGAPGAEVYLEDERSLSSSDGAQTAGDASGVPG
jgi:L-Lysine epsilon oxidase N-terminal/L-lysine epsilon oxidase C-terminal domain